MSLDSVLTPDGDWRPAADIAKAVAAHQISALDVTEAALARIERHNPTLNAFTNVTADRARCHARALDVAIARN
jgi:aspartyl-tRNA(Asn)/glutamyl-tRNA(Gln) amidotransferase subunit A